MVEPYLVTKRAEADLAFEFMALPKWANGYKHGPMPPEFMEPRVRVWERMRALKPRNRAKIEKETALHVIDGGTLL